MPILSTAEWRSASGRRENNKKKPWVDYEPRLAHGRAVNNIYIYNNNNYIYIYIYIPYELHAC